MSLLGYFFTFTTYGTWLHGTEKGSVDRENNVYGEAIVEPNKSLQDYRRKLMKDEAYFLDQPLRKIVLNAIHEHLAFRSWFLWAAHVRTNHVHIVLGIGDGLKSPDRMMTEIKGNATRFINAARPGDPRKHWTRHGSTRHLLTEAALNQAIYYTVFGQGEPMEVYEAPRK